MKNFYIILTAVCVLAVSAEAQQRPGGGGRPGGGQGGPGGGGRFGGGGEDWRQRIEEFRRNAGAVLAVEAWVSSFEPCEAKEEEEPSRRG